MNQPLTKISLLLLFFYLGWFSWEQNKRLKKQNEQISRMQKEMFYDALIIQSYQKIKKNN